VHRVWQRNLGGKRVTKKRTSLSIYLPDLSGGGAERLHLRLLPEFLKADLDVTFLLDRERGELLEPVRQLGARIVSLGADRQIKALPKLVGFLKTNKPDVLIANMEHMNVMAVLARRIANVRTRIIATQHNTFSEQAKRPSWQFKILPFAYRWTMPMADEVVAVSVGVADDLANSTGLLRPRIRVIYNGVVTEDFDERANHTPDHPWFSEAPPVVLAMGRMVEQKDFATLIEAFARVADRTDARLLILGEGPLRPRLEALVRRAGLDDRVSMPGFTENAPAYLKHSRLFVLSSRFEGFGNVVAEALACGTPVVSTNCPYGPNEILDDGRFGHLVPVGDTAKLGEAIIEALSTPISPASLQARGRFFNIASCAQSYCEIIQ
jgi:glycosyltransferase involved in cell wall biosynthesis